MKGIHIPELRQSADGSRTIEVDEVLPGLETLTPVRGQVKVTHQGTYLEVAAKAETIVTLTCHRCLQQYNHRLLVNTSELIWLDEAAEEVPDQWVEQETELEDLVESLPPNGYFQPTTWLYEQLCLALPLRQLCDKKCPGIPVEQSSSNPLIDQRWGALEILRQQLPKSQN